MEDLICLLLSPLCLCCSARLAALPVCSPLRVRRERERELGGRGQSGGVANHDRDAQEKAESRVARPPSAICELLTSHLATLTRQLLLLGWGGVGGDNLFIC